MPLVGYEWLVIVAVLVIIFLWGQRKLPELARSIGFARKEFNMASKELAAPGTSTSTQGNTDSLILAATWASPLKARQRKTLRKSLRKPLPRPKSTDKSYVKNRSSLTTTTLGWFCVI